MVLDADTSTPVTSPAAATPPDVACTEGARTAASKGKDASAPARTGPSNGVVRVSSRTRPPATVIRVRRSQREWRLGWSAGPGCAGRYRIAAIGAATVSHKVFASTPAAATISPLRIETVSVRPGGRCGAAVA